VWTRSDDDIFRLRLSKDADHRLVLLEEFTPSPRSTAVVPVAAMTIRDYYHKCDFFDAPNFLCFSAVGESNFLCFSAVGESDYVEMRDGTLTHHYWNTLRTYRAEVRLAWQ
jgi:hypothetical protein